MNRDKKKVVVGMSGGVDSSVAAAILLEQGYEVIGLTITPYKIEEICRHKIQERSCCDYQGMIDAADICEHLKIPHYFLDYSSDFREKVVDNFVEEYLKGRTPNPCVVCNPNIKWNLLQKADELGAKYMATGHYANINFSDDNQRYFVSQGTDSTKDQSYFLWKLSQEQLSRTIFPLGNYKKKDVRLLAKKFGLKVSDKLESQEICFIPNNDYRYFIRQEVKESDFDVNKGNIILNGNIIGIHKGFPYYTVGQRKGLGVSAGKPLYVKKINPGENTIEVSYEDGLYNSELLAGNINLQKYMQIDTDKMFNIKIRYRDKGSPAECEINSDGIMKISFLESKKAITPGQSVAIYENEDLVGGGIIIKSL